MSKLMGKIKKQYVFPWIGGLKDIWSMTSVYFSAINLLLISVTAYYTTISPLFKTPGAFAIYTPWLSIYIFVGGMFALVLIAMVLEYKFIYPSYFTFRNKQEYEHQNLLRGDIKLLADRLTRIEEALGITPAEESKKEPDGEEQSTDS